MQGDPAVIGEIWITFEVELFAPKTSDVPARADGFRIERATQAAPLGIVATVPTRENTLGGTISDDGITYTFPPSLSSGFYLFSYRARSGDGLVTPIDITTEPVVTNGDFSSAYYTIGSLQQNRTYGFQFVVTITAPNASVAFPVTWTVPIEINTYLLVEKWISSRIPLDPILSVDDDGERERYARFIKMENEHKKISHTHNA